MPLRGGFERPKAKALGYLEATVKVRARTEATARTKNRQQQRRNAGVSPLRRQSAPPPVEMTFVKGGMKEQQQKQRQKQQQQQRQKQIPTG